MSEQTAAEQIDHIISLHPGWKAELLAKVRSIILQADPDAVEEVKWRMANRPEGLAVWSHDGIICIAEVWKDNVKLLFFKGAHLSDPNKLFNARLKSKNDRSIEFREGDPVDAKALTELIQEKVAYNTKQAQ